MPTERAASLSPKLVLGLCAVLAGLLLTLDNLDLADTDWLFRYWPLALVALGLVVFLQAREGNGRAGGALMALVGVWLLLDSLDVIDVSVWELFWPIVLIVAGTHLVLQSLRRRRGVVQDADESMRLFAIMGGVTRTSNATRFRHADLSALWGGCELDLRHAAIPPGEQATVEVFALMGGHEIRVPKGWQVDVRVFPFMGGVDDKTVPGPDENAPRLVVRGFVMMGGLEIGN